MNSKEEEVIYYQELFEQVVNWVTNQESSENVTSALVVQGFLSDVPDIPEMYELRQLVKSFLDELILGDAAVRIT